MTSSPVYDAIMLMVIAFLVALIGRDVYKIIKARRKKKEQDGGK